MKQRTAPLHRLTLICEEDEWSGLVADLRRQDDAGVVSDIRKRIEGQLRYVELITSDLATMSALVHKRAANATCRVAKARSTKLPRSMPARQSPPSAPSLVPSDSRQDNAAPASPLSPAAAPASETQGTTTACNPTPPDTGQGIVPHLSPDSCGTIPAVGEEPA